MEDQASKIKGLAWLAGACAVGAVFAFGLSPLAHIIPWSWEKKMGAALAFDLPQQECRANAQAEALLKRLVMRLYPVQPGDTAFSIEVEVVPNPAVNAYASLGGRIFINSGLMKQAQSPEEVAGVLAHEITHVEHRHILEGALAHTLTSEGIKALFGEGSSAAEWSDYFLKMDFTRGQEAQADEGGLKRLQKAHIDNQGFKHFFERMETSGAAADFLSDHPSNGARIEMVENFANQNVTPLMSHDEWKILKSYCGEK